MKKDTLDRKWQRQCLQEYRTGNKRDYLVVATPGSGKTHLAVQAIAHRINNRSVGRVCVVVPTNALRTQWAEAAHKLGVHLEPNFRNGDPWPRGKFNGLAITYHQVASQPLFFRGLFAKGSLIVFDEIHHAADDLAWGRKLREAFDGCSFRLALSGTPFRTDQNEIPFVKYADGKCQPDYSYGYQKAMDDGFCRAIYFPRAGGTVEWQSSEGQYRRASFDDGTSERIRAERLRAALSADGEWLPGALRMASRQLLECREDEPNAGGIVFCLDQSHARAVAKLLRSITGDDPSIAISDEPDAKNVIDRFRASTTEWLIAVRMVSEGIDIPRLKVGVYATNNVTDVSVWQATGRLLRVTNEEFPDAHLILPADPKLTEIARRMERDVEHHVKAQIELLNTEKRPRPDAGPSLFAPISSTLEKRGMVYAGESFTQAEIDMAEKIRAVCAQELSVALIAKIRRFGAEHEPPGEPPKAAPERPLYERRRNVRGLISKMVRRVAMVYEEEPREIHVKLNKAVDVPSIKDASPEELDLMLEIINEWAEDGPPL